MRDGELVGRKRKGKKEIQRSGQTEGGRKMVGPEAAASRPSHGPDGGLTQPKPVSCPPF